ncbi:ATP-binding cassette domain-containing protein, partial [Seohaeicola zhoushanensis]|uniref:ATP-binding cassette domain-containing protein n=1 Tax=Seohaeicola zhoushanensis TaxID=1569283 RepID=UPI0027E514F4
MRAELGALLELRNAQIVYDNAIEAVRDVSLSVPEGSVVALLGSNGAGKSTLLKAVTGTLHLEEGALEKGAIRFAGQDISH